MKFFKICYKIFILFTINFLIFTTVLADDLYPKEDDFDISDIMKDLDSITASSNSEELPTINSRAYVVIDRKSNKIIVGKNENQKKKMASTTKIMTCLVVIENANLSDEVIVSKKAAGTGGSRLGLKTGDKITVHDLLYGLMLCSGNDAAVALAEHVSGSITSFSELMNKKANDLGLKNTHFVTPHGLDKDDHYTTAYELAILSNYALENETFKKIVGTKQYTVTINGYPKALLNTNELLGVLNGVYGIKTGFTNGANRCLVTGCKRGEMDLICVVLGADTKKMRTTDSIKLLEYAFNNYTYVNVAEIIKNYFETWKTDNLKNFIIDKGRSNNISLDYTSIKNPIIPIKSSLINSFNVFIDCNFNLSAPIYKDMVVGNITLELQNDIIYTSNLVITSEIKKKEILDYFIYFLKNIYSINYNFINHNFI